MKPNRLLSAAPAFLLIASSLTACAENTNHLETQENTNSSVNETNETEISDDLSEQEDQPFAAAADHQAG